MALQVQKRMTNWWFTPEDHVEEEDPPRFQVRSLTGAQRLEVLSDFDHKREVIGHEGVKAALKYGLLDWQNIVDENDKPLKCSQANVQYLPSEIITEVALEIILNSELDEEEEEPKKSPSPQS